MTQLELEFEPLTESSADRLRRILAGVVGVTTAKAMTFTEPNAREASQRAKATDAELQRRNA